MAKRVRYPADVKAKLTEIAINAEGKKPKARFEDATAAGYNGNQNAWQNYEAGVRAKAKVSKKHKAKPAAKAPAARVKAPAAPAKPAAVSAATTLDDVARNYVLKALAVAKAEIERLAKQYAK